MPTQLAHGLKVVVLKVDMSSTYKLLDFGVGIGEHNITLECIVCTVTTLFNFAAMDDTRLGSTTTCLESNGFVSTPCFYDSSISGVERLLLVFVVTRSRRREPTPHFPPILLS